MKFFKIKDELKKTLSLLMAEQAPEVKVSDMVIGGKVEVVNSDGSLSDAPDGEYTVDKDVIEVKDGLIVSINGEKAPKEDAPVEEAKMDEAPTDAPVDPNADLKAEVEALKAETESLKAAIQEIKDAMAGNADAEQKMSEQFSKQVEDLNATIKTLMDMPAEFSKTNESVKVKDDKEAKKNAWSAILASTMKK